MTYKPQEPEHMGQTLRNTIYMVLRRPNQAATLALDSEPRSLTSFVLAGLDRALAGWLIYLRQTCQNGSRSLPTTLLQRRYHLHGHVVFSRTLHYPHSMSFYDLSLRLRLQRLSYRQNMC